MTSLLLLALIGAAPEAGWSVRYANYDVITKAQREEGAIPAWSVEVTGDGLEQEISIGGDQKGDRIGQVLLGRPLDLGDPRPRTLLVKLELQAACAMNDRTPPLGVMLLSPQAWERLATEPQTADMLPTWQPSQRLAFQGITYPEDSTAWIPWTSTNLAARFNSRTPQQLVLVLSFAGMHTGAEEWARFRRVEVSMSNTVIAKPARTLRWPLKTARTLHDDAAVARARQLVTDNPDAANLLKGVVAASAAWLEVPFEDLTWRLPDASVPRAFNDSVSGCPVHGAAIYRHGTYPWKLDFAQPFKITCPIGGEVYPSNDFLRYYRSGYQDKSALGGEFSDDGWGWTPPGGERHWLVAYANHWFWSKYNVPGVLSLSRAYLLTGDRRYAHQAAAMLARIADIYPDMDHEFQSRYGSLSPGYSGKILNHIWETGLIQNLAEAYDNIWETIDGDTELQRLRGQSGEQIRDLIERNLIEEGIDSILDGHIQGNFGMHQNALAVLVAVRQNAPSRAVLSEILDRTGAEGRYEGIQYALYNWIHRDGVPYETSPGYNFGWVANLVETAELLERAGVDLYAEPQFRRLLQWPLDITVNGTNTPALGDAGDTRHGLGFGNFNVYRAAFERFGGADFAWALEKSGGLTRSFATYDSLFSESAQEKLKQIRAEQPRPPKPSRVLDGYGMVVLNNPAETVGLMNYYGWRGGHSHRDGLTFDLYAWGKALTPDTGYPDFMNDKIPGIYSWSKATIAHNTVTVDAKQQTGNAGGTVRRFARTPWVQYSDVEAPGNYPGIKEYRRALLVVSTDEQHAYAVDLFRVAGGTQHDYSLHGTIGSRSVVSGQFGPPQTKGTLAGEEVAVGQFYDDPKLGEPGYEGGYGRYVGSGFQHLINPQWQTDQGPAVVEVVPETDPKVRLRIHVVPQAAQQIVLAEARVSPVKNPQLLPYLIARRSGADLASTFITVLDPFQEQPVVTGVEKLPTSDDAVALRIAHGDGYDVLLQAREGGPNRTAGEILSSDAALVVARFAADGSLQSASAVGGSQLRVGDRVFPLTPAANGEITAVDLAANTITVRWQGVAPPADELVGRSLHVGNDRRSNLLTITAARADGEETVLTPDASLAAGRGRVIGCDEKTATLRSDTNFLFSALYPGMRAANEQRGAFRPILAVSNGEFRLGPGPSLAEQFVDSDGSGKTEFWVSVAGPGDAVRLERPTLVP